MAKTVKRLWPQFLDRENFKRAVKAAGKNKRCRLEVLKYNARQEEHIQATRADLERGTWKPGPYRDFIVLEPKKRLISAPCFRDRVVHHALVQIIEPHFEKRFIRHSYACRKGKGTHAASARMTAMLRGLGSGYALKADISKYFPHIDHAILLRAVARVIGDPRINALIRGIITEGPHKGCGLPIGALTSQLFANIYLDRLDHYAKDVLGVRLYIRYMDDFIILHREKAELWRLLGLIESFLATELKLTLNPKTDIFPISRGVDFAGYRHWPTLKKPRKKNVQAAKRRFAALSRAYWRGEVELPEVRSVMASFLGYMKYCNGHRSTISALERLVLVRPAGEEEEGGE